MSVCVCLYSKVLVESETQTPIRSHPIIEFHFRAQIRKAPCAVDTAPEMVCSLSILCV